MCLVTTEGEKIVRGFVLALRYDRLIERALTPASVAAERNLLLNSRIRMSTLVVLYSNKHFHHT